MKRLLVPMLLLVTVLAVCDIDNHCKIGSTGNISLFLINSTDNTYVSGANCLVDIVNSTYDMITYGGVMSDKGLGFYEYGLSGNETSCLGTNTILYNCTTGIYISHGSESYQVVDDLPMLYLGRIDNSTTYMNSTLFPQWNTWLNETWYNIVTPDSSMIVNIFNYLNGRLTMMLNYTDKVDIAQMVWNSTIVPRRESAAATSPTWQDWGQGFG